MLQAVRIVTDTLVAPWNEPAGDLPVLGVPLRHTQDAALLEVGAVIVDCATPGVPCFVFSDRQWFTPALLQKVLAAGIGRVQLEDDALHISTGALQRAPVPNGLELAVRIDGISSLDDLPWLVVQPGLEDHGAEVAHPRLRHAFRPLRVGAAIGQVVRHWTHLVRVNQLAIQAEAYAARDRFMAASFVDKALQSLRVVLRARGVSESALGAALVQRGKGVVIHPTAVVEASRIGDGAVIGPHAVVRGSIVGPGTRVGEHAVVVASVLGGAVDLGPYTHLRFCTVMDGARLSSGAGFQLCVFGRDCFVAWGVVAQDLSFGRTIRVQDGDDWVDSEHHFLGVSVGHRAVVGQGVRLGAGTSVPNDVTLVDANPVFRTASGEGVLEVGDDGVARPRRRAR